MGHNWIYKSLNNLWWHICSFTFKCFLCYGVVIIQAPDYFFPLLSSLNFVSVSGVVVPPVLVSFRNLTIILCHIIRFFLSHQFQQIIRMILKNIIFSVLQHHFSFFFLLFIWLKYFTCLCNSHIGQAVGLSLFLCQLPSGFTPLTWSAPTIFASESFISSSTLLRSAALPFPKCCTLSSLLLSTINYYINSRSSSPLILDNQLSVGPLLLVKSGIVSPFIDPWAIPLNRFLGTNTQPIAQE